MLVLHMVNPVLIPSLQYGLLIPSGIIPKLRVRNEGNPGVVLKIRGGAKKEGEEEEEEGGRG